MLSFKTSYLPHSLHYLHVDSEIIIAIALVSHEFLHRNVVCRFEILKTWSDNINLFTKQTRLAFFILYVNIFTFSVSLSLVQYVTLVTMWYSQPNKFECCWGTNDVFITNRNNNHMNLNILLSNCTIAKNHESISNKKLFFEY